MVVATARILDVYHAATAVTRTCPSEHTEDSEPGLVQARIPCRRDIISEPREETDSVGGRTRRLFPGTPGQMKRSGAKLDKPGGTAGPLVPAQESSTASEHDSDKDP